MNRFRYRRFQIRAAAAAFVIAACAAGSARAEIGVTADRIVFGQIAALEGPAAALGLGMQAGLQAAFDEANIAGGVKGRKLQLVSVNDGYEPEKAVAAAKQLIAGGQIFALAGSVGTPTSAAVEPLASEAGIPFVGAFTGAEFLRQADKPNVVNIRASYAQETEAMVAHLTADLGASRIAVLYQNDAFGQAGLAGVRHALDRRRMAPIAEASYERNTVEVAGALHVIKDSDPQAVIMIGAYKPCAEFIRQARRAKLDATFVNISFVGSDALTRELGSAGAGVVVTQVVPFPGDTSIKLVRRYQAALKHTRPDAPPGFVSLEGYMVGRLLVAALAKIEGEVTRAALLDAVKRAGPFDLGGFTLRYGAHDNRGSNRVYLTVIQADGSFRPIDQLSKFGD
jgi:ABC-type branched-subunit amino acid transport system substrate-binding protein